MKQVWVLELANEHSHRFGYETRFFGGRTGSNIPFVVNQERALHYKTEHAANCALTTDMKFEGWVAKQVALPNSKTTE